VLACESSIVIPLMVCESTLSARDATSANGNDSPSSSDRLSSSIANSIAASRSRQAARVSASGKASQ